MDNDEDAPVTGAFLFNQQRFSPDLCVCGTTVAKSCPTDGCAMPLSRTTLARIVAAAFIALPASWLVATAATGSRDGSPLSNFSNDPNRLVYATAHWTTRAQLNRIASLFQHVQVDEKNRTASVEADADELMQLRRMGIRVEIDDAATERMRIAEQALAERETLARQGLRGQALVAAEAIPNFSCYRTVEETYGTMDALASQFPNLARTIDIGPSWTWQKTGGAQGYRLRVLRVNNTATDAKYPNKQRMVVLAAIHAREYTTAELVTRFAEWLVRGYGRDSEATWLVDNFQFHFLLQANPDGRKKAESGISWRKNTDTDNGACAANDYGVDLNRNWTWQWSRTAGGSSSNACAVNYRGTSAASEAETQDAMKYIVGTPGANGVYTGGVLPDQRTDTGVAPYAYPGLFLDIHSFSRLVLWPWANTSATAPNMVSLRTLGRRLAYFNNYAPKQWIGLYPADGTNTDTVYGITGAPSYTVELGSAFFESCSTFESTTYPQNLSMLKYAARNLGGAYVYPGGPETTSVGTSAVAVKRGAAFAVSGYVDDSRFNQSEGAEAVQNIVRAQAFVDAQPWALGNTPIEMRASDGVFNTSREQVVANINTANLWVGWHHVFVRGVDASGRAGTPKVAYFQVTN